MVILVLIYKSTYIMNFIFKIHSSFQGCLFFLLVFIGINATAQIPEEEKAYLVKFYTATSGENWENKWDLNTNVRSWYGLEIEEGHVTGLNLFRNNLEGRIPKGISALKSLNRLNLGFNALEGKLPAELFELTELQSLRLEMNKLSGSLPKAYSKLDKLEELSIYNNLLEGAIPKGIGAMPLLKTLNLSSNYLEGNLPTSIEKLSNLERLELFGNKLSGQIDVEFGQLKKLKELILSYNFFTGDLPSSTANLTNLEFVQLQGNDFTSLNSLLYLKSPRLSVFDSDDAFLNMKFGQGKMHKLHLADSKFVDGND